MSQNNAGKPNDTSARRSPPAQEKAPKTQAKQAAGGKHVQGKKKTAAPQRTGKALVLHRIYLALTIVSAVIVAVYVGWNLFSAPPDPNKPGIDGEGVTRPPQITTMIDPETGEEIQVEIPGLSNDRKDQFYTFLVVGKSQETGGGLTDTMLLAAYDVPNQSLSVMSLPRDTWVVYNGRTRLLNTVYNTAGGDKDGKGVQGLKRAVKDLTGVYPDFYVTLEWEAVGELVDAIGGVDFEVPFNMYYNDLSQHFKIDLKKGWQTLNGEQAMGLIRWRHNSDDRGNISDSYGYAEGDIGRIKTQQSFLKAVIKKCLQPDVILKNLGGYITIFQENVETDLSVGNLSYFVKSAVGGLDMDHVAFSILPNGSAGDGAHLLPAGRQIVKAINEGFNPYLEDIQLGELQLATKSPLAVESPKPSESADPDESPEPSEGTQDPEESPEPSGGEGDPLLPPGVTGRPTASPGHSGSATDPAESGEPNESPEAGGGQGAAEPTPEPPPAQTPVPELTPPPVQEPSDQPLLPPGVFG